MYIYVIDTTTIKKNSNIVSQIRQYSKNFSIDGVYIYLSALHDIKKDLSINLKDKSNTVVVVGDYNSFNKIIDTVFQLNKTDSVVFGYISTEGDNISKIFGMTSSIEKDVLLISQRSIKEIDICSVNNKYFLDFIEFDFSYGFNIEIDASYIINLKNNCELVVGNLFFNNKNKKLTNCFDNNFDVFLYSKEKSKKNMIGKLKAKKLNITSKFNIKYSVNGFVYKSNNIQIDILSKGLKIIIGKSSVLNDMLITC